MSLHRRSVLAGLASLSASLAARPSFAADLPSVIRLGAVGFGVGKPFGTGVLPIADAKGLVAREFEGTPVKLEFSYFTGTGPAINEAISNRQLDFASYGSVPNIIGRANGLSTRLLMSSGGTDMFAGARPELQIHKIADLKGKRVTLQKATVLHWGLIRALHEAGLSEKDVTIVDLKTADQLAALAAKSVDAVFGASFVLPLQDKGIIDIFYSSKDIGPKGAAPGAILSTDDFRTRYPDATLRVVRGMLRAAAYIADESHRQEVFEIFSRSGTPVKLFNAQFKGVKLKDSYNPLIDDFYKAQYASVIAFDKEQRLIRREPDLAKWIDASFLDRALKDTGLGNVWPRRQPNGTVAK
jgi:sulfonate transport system substrate-binding protein